MTVKKLSERVNTCTQYCTLLSKFSNKKEGEKITWKIATPKWKKPFVKAAVEMKFEHKL